MHFLVFLSGFTGPEIRPRFRAMSISAFAASGVYLKLGMIDGILGEIQSKYTVHLRIEIQTYMWAWVCVDDISGEICD